jgi:hypothetical protein
MNEPQSNPLREKVWRQKPTPAERARLRADPDLELEARLTEALTKLPDAPVPSNFTARVLQAVESETAAVLRPRLSRWHWFWHSLAPKSAYAVVLAALALFAYHGQAAAKRARLARSVAAVSEVASAPSPEILQDFETIRRLNPAPKPDQELLALLQ